MHFTADILYIYDGTHVYIYLCLCIGKRRDHQINTINLRINDAYLPLKLIGSTFDFTLTLYPHSTLASNRFSFI
jgi:hypothetical protein